MMNLMHWRLLVAVADHGSITAAAEQVGMTQSAASQAMASMEATLGAQLFTREPRKTLPTALGLSVIEFASTKPRWSRIGPATPQSWPGESHASMRGA